VSDLVVDLCGLLDALKDLVLSERLNLLVIRLLLGALLYLHLSAQLTEVAVCLRDDLKDTLVLGVFDQDDVLLPVHLFQHLNTLLLLPVALNLLRLVLHLILAASLCSIVAQGLVLLLVKLKEVTMEVQDLCDLFAVLVALFQLLSVAHDLLKLGHHFGFLLAADHCFWRLHSAVKLAI
jgi:hypothetical protein